MLEIVQAQRDRFRTQVGEAEEASEALRRKVAESGRPGRPELLAKKGRTVGGVGCPPNCRTSGKPRGSSDLLELFGKMLQCILEKIPKKFGEIW